MPHAEIQSGVECRNCGQGIVVSHVSLLIDWKIKYYCTVCRRTYVQKCLPHMIDQLMVAAVQPWTPEWESEMIALANDWHGP